MSVEAIKNQPIQFDVPSNACTCGNLPFKQLVNISTDISQIQFKVEPCLTAQNVIRAGAFTDADEWVVTDAFAIDESANLACKSAGSIGTLQQYNIFNTNTFYIVEVIVDSITETMQVWAGTQQVGTIDGVGRFVYAFKATGDGFSIRSFSTTNEACIASISAYELDSRLIVAIFDEDGTFQTSITLADNEEYFRFSKNFLTVRIDWDALGITAGCYYIGIADPCINTNGQNGIFDPNVNNGTEEGGWDFTEGADATITFSPSGGVNYRATNFSPTGDASISDPFTVFQAGLSYDYDISIGNIGSGSADIDINIGTGTNSHAAVSAGSVNLTGTVVAGGATPMFSIDYSPNSIPVDLSIFSIVVTLTNPSDMEPDLTSVQFKAGEHDCSVLLNTNCNEDNLGFEFDDSLFNPLIRLEGELINANYPTVRTTIEDTDGKNRILYGERKKAYQLILGLIPEYVLDYVSLLPIFDNLWVEGDKYHVLEDTLDIEYPDGSANSGRLVMRLVRQEDTLFNTSVAQADNDNQLLVNDFIVDPTVTDTIIAEPSTGDRLKAI